MEQDPYVIRYLIDLLKHMKEHRSYDGRDESFKRCIGELTYLLKHMKEHRSYDGRDESFKCCIGELTDLLKHMKEYRSYDGRDESFKCCIGKLTDLLKHIEEYRSYDGGDELITCCIASLTKLLQRIEMITIRPDNIRGGTFTEPKKDAVDLKTIAVCMLKVNGKKNIEIEGKIEMIESRIRC
jgi:hypothetical protein